LSYQKYFLYGGKMIILQNEIQKLHENVEKILYIVKNDRLCPASPICHVYKQGRPNNSILYLWIL